MSRGKVRPEKLGWELTKGRTSQLIRRKVGQVCRSLRLGRHDAEDLQQTIRLELLRRSKSFDPSRGPWGAFAYTATNNLAATLYRKLKRKPVIASLNETHDGLSLGAVLTQHDGLRRMGRSETTEEQLEFRIDLEALSEQLSLDDQKLVEILQVLNRAEAARYLNTPWSTLADRARKLRKPLADLDPCRN